MASIMEIRQARQARRDATSATPGCVHCGTPVESPQDVCMSCLEKLTRPESSATPSTATPSIVVPLEAQGGKSIAELEAAIKALRASNERIGENDRKEGEARRATQPGAVVTHTPSTQVTGTPPGAIPESEYASVFASMELTPEWTQDAISRGKTPYMALAGKRSRFHGLVNRGESIESALLQIEGIRVPGYTCMSDSGTHYRPTTGQQSERVTRPQTPGIVTPVATPSPVATTDPATELGRIFRALLGKSADELARSAGDSLEGDVRMVTELEGLLPRVSLHLRAALNQYRVQTLESAEDDMRMQVAEERARQDASTATPSTTTSDRLNSDIVRIAELEARIRVAELEAQLAALKSA